MNKSQNIQNQNPHAHSTTIQNIWIRHADKSGQGLSDEGKRRSIALGLFMERLSKKPELNFPLINKTPWASSLISRVLETAEISMLAASRYGINFPENTVIATDLLFGKAKSQAETSGNPNIPVEELVKSLHAIKSRALGKIFNINAALKYAAQYSMNPPPINGETNEQTAARIAKARKELGIRTDAAIYVSHSSAISACHNIEEKTVNFCHIIFSTHASGNHAQPKIEWDMYPEEITDHPSHYLMKTSLNPEGSKNIIEAANENGPVNIETFIDLIR